MKFGNRGLLVLLGVLCVVIVALATGILIVKKDSINKDNISIDEVISDINEQYKGDVLSSEGALVFYEYMQDKMRSNEYSDSDVYTYYEEILNKVSDDLSRLQYLSYYADIFFENEDDLDGSINILKRFEPYAVDGEYKSDYYAALSSMYEKGGNTEESDYYNDLLMDMSSSEVYHIDDGIIFTGEGESEDNI